MNQQLIYPNPRPGGEWKIANEKRTFGREDVDSKSKKSPLGRGGDGFVEPNQLNKSVPNLPKSLPE
jgi:hypothetical protein